MSIRFDEADARAMGRNTKGVKGINLREGDEVVGMVVAEPGGYLLTLCEKGYGKRTPFGANMAGEPTAETEAEAEEPEETAEEPTAEGESPAEGAETPADKSSMRYRKQRRGGKGIRDIRTTDRNGPVVGTVAVHDGDDIMLITAQGMVIGTHVNEIRIVGRNTQGVCIMDLREGDKLVSIAKIAKEEVPDARDTVILEPPPSPPDESPPP